MRRLYCVRMRIRSSRDYVNDRATPKLNEYQCDALSARQRNVDLRSIQLLTTLDLAHT